MERLALVAVYARSSVFRLQWAIMFLAMLCNIVTQQYVIESHGLSTLVFSA